MKHLGMSHHTTSPRADPANAIRASIPTIENHIGCSQLLRSLCLLVSLDIFKSRKAKQKRWCEECSSTRNCVHPELNESTFFGVKVTREVDHSHSSPPLY